MTIEQKLELVKLQMIVTAICIEYPNDTDKIQQALIIMENFIDSCINDALSKVIGSKTAVYSDGFKKSRN